MEFAKAVDRFRRWADAYPATDRSGEWELEYEQWPQLYTAFSHLVATTTCRQWSQQLADLVLYAIARDNESGTMIHELGTEPENLLCLAERAVEAAEPAARWQIAVALGRSGVQPERTEPLLFALAHDDDAYVRRRALMALADMGSPLVNDLVEPAWASGDRYQRMAVLYALTTIDSPRISEFVRRAEGEDDITLIDYARQLGPQQSMES